VKRYTHTVMAPGAPKMFVKSLTLNVWFLGTACVVIVSMLGGAQAEPPPGAELQETVLSGPEKPVAFTVKTEPLAIEAGTLTLSEAARLSPFAPARLASTNRASMPTRTHRTTL